jgi:hypothetical protein
MQSLNLLWFITLGMAKKTDCNIQYEIITLPHQIAAKGQSKHLDVLYQLHQTKQWHLETSQASWSTGLHHHVQHNQGEHQSALQPELNKYVNISYTAYRNPKQLSA